MDNNGWIKLHRKLLDNDILHDENALKMFLWLLLKADRKTGEKKVARSWASEELRMHPSTFYKTLRRLEKKHKMVTALVTPKYTIIKLTNWHKYQDGNSFGNSEVTSKEQQGNTLQEVRSKNKEVTTSSKDTEKSLLTLTNGQKRAYMKKYPGLTLEVINAEKVKCNLHMQMSSGDYRDPGIYFNGWLKKVYAEKLRKEQNEIERKYYNGDTDFTPEQLRENLKRVNSIREVLLKK